MPLLIRLIDGEIREAEDTFALVEAEGSIPDGDVILPLARFLVDAEALLHAGRRVGVRLESHEEVEALAYDLPRVAVLALDFPKFRDGRAYTNARLARERYGFKGEIRAVGDVLREQAGFMARCGFDAFAPADGSDAGAWAAAVSRYRHVYQPAADRRAPAYAERAR